MADGDLIAAVRAYVADQELPGPVNRSASDRTPAEPLDSRAEGLLTVSGDTGAISAGAC
ncbi:hypothetical protein STXM2123_1711 [Streptomyces sp. F-3]|nr:hypothetical protein STXM2123_1711 [Streptomyces sp. F-3]